MLLGNIFTKNITKSSLLSVKKNVDNGAVLWYNIIRKKTKENDYAKIIYVHL